MESCPNGILTYRKSHPLQSEFWPTRNFDLRCDVWSIFRVSQFSVVFFPVDGGNGLLTYELFFIYVKQETLHSVYIICLFSIGYKLILAKPPCKLSTKEL